jgi:2-phospho-L-lactate guanylyltransferase
VTCPSASWVVVVPQKRLRRAKSRMSELSVMARRQLVVHMAETVVAFAADVPCVDRVFLLVEEAWPTADVPILRQRAGHGLNEALRDADAVVRRRWPRHHLAVLPADTAAGSAVELSAALDLAAGHPRAVVADRQGTGTVLLTRAAGTPLAPRFGAGSRLAHVRNGAVDLTVSLDVPGLRCDLDTMQDLADAGWAAAPTRCCASPCGDAVGAS